MKTWIWLDTFGGGRLTKADVICDETFGVHFADGLWRVTHIPSGRAVSACRSESRREAIERAEWLWDLFVNDEVDWWLDLDDPPYFKLDEFRDGWIKRGEWIE